MKQFSLTDLRGILSGQTELRHFEAQHANYQSSRDLVQAQIEKLEARAAEWVALLEPKLQRIEYKDAINLDGYVLGARQDQDIADEVVRILEARYGDTWLIEAAYGYGDHDKFLDHNPPWFFKFTRKCATAA